MVVALNLSRAQREQVIGGTSPLAELMACLHVLAEPDHHPEAIAWAARVNDAIDSSLRGDLYRFSPLWARYRTRLFYPRTRELDRSIDEELDDLTSMDDRTFLALTAEGIIGRGSMLSEDHDFLGDRAWVTYCEHRSFGRGDLAHSLLGDQHRFRAELVSVLTRCCEAFYRDEWEKSEPQLTAAVNTLNRQLATSDLLHTIESLSEISSSRGSTTTVFFDKLQSANLLVDQTGLLLIPTLRGWPHLMVKSDPGLPIVIHFPARGRRGQSDGQSQSDVRSRLLALAEPGRWELCRHLIGESITTTELTLRTGLSAPAVSRHLRVLREAGMVSSQREGRQVFHRMHSSLILQLGNDVMRAIVR